MKEFDICTVGEGVYVCCDVVHNDLYPATNLINREKNSTGFLAEYYIRPPVNLYFHLPVPVTLVEISADTELGSQSSLVFSIAGSTSRNVKCSSSCKRKDSETEPDVVIEGETDYEDLGKGNAANGNIVFTNYSESTTEGYRLNDRSRKGVLKRIKVLRLTILRTKDSSVPCLKNLKILVKPTSKSDQVFLENLRKETKVTTSFNFFGGESNTEEAQPTSSSQILVKDPEENVPSEFLDEITHEIMLVPMILPSGKIVDRSTVDKCNKAQAVYGGLPRDPFSGTVYTSNLKPLFNANLKSRIDAYLVQNNVRMTQGQTLGDASAIEKFMQNRANPLKRKLEG